MNRICCLTGLALFSVTAFAQKYEVRIGVNQGVNMVMIGAAPSTWHPSQSTSLFASFSLRPKSSPVYFSSSLAYGYHSFTSKANKFLLLSYPQSSWCFSLQAGLTLKKRVAFAAGLFVQQGVPDNKNKLYLTDRSGTGTYTNGFDNLAEGYRPTPLQGGLQFGITIGLGEKEIVAVDLRVQQYASRITEADYYLVSSFSANRQLLISAQARPTVLLAGLSFKISTERRVRDPAQSRWKPWML